MVSRPLIPERTLQQLQGISRRSMRSTARIGTIPTVSNNRGGTRASGPIVWRGPYPCRLDPSGLAAGEAVRGEQITSVTYGSIALPLDVEPPSATDQIEVTTPVVGSATSVVERFTIIGDPFVPSYGVELSVAVNKIG